MYVTGHLFPIDKIPIKEVCVQWYLQYPCAELCVDDGEGEGEDDEDEGRHEPQPRLDELHGPQLSERLQVNHKVKINGLTSAAVYDLKCYDSSGNKNKPGSWG